jgi:hypothetical protein
MNKYMAFMLIILFIGHWVSDFLWQGRWMAHNKSSNILALSIHSLIYGIGMSLYWWVGDSSVFNSLLVI